MKKISSIIKGKRYSDTRGTLQFNNDFNATEVKRIYFIENASVDVVRGWQGHQIEQRWFSAVQGSFKIEIRIIDNWEQPARDLPFQSFLLNADALDILHVPSGCITSIQSVTTNSKLMAMSDYVLGAISDEFRYDSNYFNN